MLFVFMFNLLIIGLCAYCLYRVVGLRVLNALIPEQEEVNKAPTKDSSLSDCLSSVEGEEVVPVKRRGKKASESDEVKPKVVCRSKKVVEPK